MQPDFEVAGVLKQHWQQVLAHAGINSWQIRVLGAIKNCRTAALGGHVDACTDCGLVRISYNSCRNRHCPKCQGNKREEWIANREAELLPVPYFHVVFTLPDTLNTLALHQPKALYEALFEAAWGTINTFGNNPKNLGAATGMIAILNTWGQQLSLHPHLHCIIPGGGLSKSGRWKTAKSSGKFLFPVKAMSKVFRAKYVGSLKAKIDKADKDLINALFKKEWVVFAKRPFGSPQSVIEYLGRYTHKIAISNHRIKNIGPDTVSFSYRDYRKAGQKGIMTLDALEFIRRFSMHILPKGFVRIRHYGILSSTGKKGAVPIIKEQCVKEGWVLPDPRIREIYNPKICPHCKTETMITLETLPKRGPPAHAKLMETARLNLKK